MRTRIGARTTRATTGLSPAHLLALRQLFLDRRVQDVVELLHVSRDTLYAARSGSSLSVPTRERLERALEAYRRGIS